MKLASLRFSLRNIVGLDGFMCQLKFKCSISVRHGLLTFSTHGAIQMGRRPDPYRARRLDIDRMRANVAALTSTQRHRMARASEVLEDRSGHVIDRTSSYEADDNAVPSGIDRQLPAASTNQ
jgi:hypothetical protein